jgi:hypothetical protein
MCIVIRHARIAHFAHAVATLSRRRKFPANVARRMHGSESLVLGTANDGRITKWRFYT